MIPALAQIDNLFIQIQDYIDMPYQYWQTFTPDEVSAFERKLRDTKEENLRIQGLAGAKLYTILPLIQPIEIIEAYNEGSRLLKLAISGYLYTDFNEAFVPLMINEIKKGTPRISSLFLQSLTDHLGTKIASLIIAALDIKNTQEQAIFSVDQLQLMEAIPKLREIAQNRGLEVSSLAQEILTGLERSS